MVNKYTRYLKLINDNFSLIPHFKIRQSTHNKKGNLIFSMSLKQLLKQSFLIGPQWELSDDVVITTVLYKSTSEFHMSMKVTAYLVQA